MKVSEAERTGCWYRLRGEVDGVARSFLVAPGENRLGSLPTNDVVLPVRGVSRLHAVLSAGDDGVTVRDLESKNGLLVNGERRGEATMAPGDRLRVGPVRLELEMLEAGDARLAILLPATPEASPATGDGARTPLLSALGPAVGSAWLQLVDAMVQAMQRTPRPDVAAALGRLAEGLGARGVCLARVADDGEPVVLASWGEVGRPAVVGERPRVGEVRSFDHREGDDALGARLGLVDGSLTVAAWGCAVGAAEAVPLLRVVLRLVAYGVPAQAEPERRREPAAATGSGCELSFPPGYVVGTSPAARALHEEMGAVAASALPVLVHGETGVGKEPIAPTL
ncbi:MAG TPA: FHA domain-containing protein, partial [Thermoanaerobaculia bacterium]|nr:FHA domain-containing protein [Thermoanaerobaculia bacterium]